jgi:hypothetical protein
MDHHKPATGVTTLGRDPDAQDGVVNPPVYRASTFLCPTHALQLAPLQPDAVRAVQNVRREMAAAPATIAVIES